MMFIYRDEYYDKESEREGERRPDHRQAPQRRARRRRADVPEGVPALHVLRRRRPLLAVDGRLPRRTLRRLRLPRTTRRRGVARPCSLPAGADRAQAGGRARGPDPAALPRGLASTASRCARSSAPNPHVVREVRQYVGAIAEQLDAGPRAVVHRRRRHRQDDARDARSPRRRWRPTARSRSTRCRGCSPQLRDTYDDDARYSLNELIDRLARRRPAAHRRRRRRADHAVGARAALLDRQRALRGRARRSCSRRTSSARRATTRCASRSASAPSRGLRDLRRPEPMFGARPAARVDYEPLPAAGAPSWDGEPPPTASRARRGGASPRRLTPRHGRHRDRRRPVGRRGQGQDHRPARRERRPRDPLPGRQQRRPHDRPRRRQVEVPPDPVRDPLPGQAAARSATAS